MNVLNQEVAEKFSIYNGDSVEVLKGIPDNSIHYSVFSPPSHRFIPIQIATAIWATARPTRNSTSISAT